MRPTPARDRMDAPVRREPTPRQIEVFLAVLEETTYAAAAKRLNVSLETVKSAMTSLFRRTGATDQANLAYLLYRRYGSRMVVPRWHDRRWHERRRRR